MGGDAATLASIPAASNVYMFMDGGYIHLGYSHVTFGSGASVYLPGTKELGIGGTITSGDQDLQSDYQSGRHFQGVCMGFADGHAKWLKTSTVLAEAKKPANSASNLPFRGGHGGWKTVSQVWQCT